MGISVKWLLSVLSLFFGFFYTTKELKNSDKEGKENKATSGCPTLQFPLR